VVEVEKGRVAAVEERGEKTLSEFLRNSLRRLIVSSKAFFKNGKGPRDKFWLNRAMVEGFEFEVLSDRSVISPGARMYIVEMGV